MNPTETLDETGPAAALEIGSRLTEPPSERLVSVVFERELKAQLGLAAAIGLVDLAHTLTLAERTIIPRTDARALIAALLALDETPDSFIPSPEYGDLYTNRESWLAMRTTSVGWLGVARARREALTTAYHLVLCDELLGLGEALAGAVETIVSLSLRHRESLMPDYTYLQAAQPTTLSHYLQSFAWPMLRDLDRIRALYERADQCPAGIGSLNGSVIYQDRRRLADRLGFRRPVPHTRDAMWQADIALETCSVALAAVVNLDRLAEDLMILASSEFGFVALADRHARASKIMPQKRNPYALAFVRATANRLIGLLAGVAAAGRTPSAQMDNRLFPYESVPDAVRSAAEAAALTAECLTALSFNEARARSALEDSSAYATDFAERLVIAAGIDYRSAHKIVGRLVRKLEESGRSLGTASAGDVGDALASAGLPADCVTDDLVSAALDPATCISARVDVGGAAPEEVSAMASHLTEAIRRSRQSFEALRLHRSVAIQNLRAEATRFAEDVG